MRTMRRSCAPCSRSARTSNARSSPKASKRRRRPRGFAKTAAPSVKDSSSRSRWTFAHSKRGSRRGRLVPERGQTRRHGDAEEAPRMIQVRDTDFPEAKVYVPDVFEDDRGFFKETYSY